MTENNMTWHGTTILSVRKNGEVVVAGDGPLRGALAALAAACTCRPGRCSPRLRRHRQPQLQSARCACVEQRVEVGGARRERRLGGHLTPAAFAILLFLTKVSDPHSSRLLEINSVNALVIIAAFLICMSMVIESFEL